jgi:exonuclease III
MNLPFPDIMLGDFNLVEDAIDCLPSHPDTPNTVKALDSFKRSFQLQDGWRAEHSTKHSFSFLQTGTGVQSRIDRIYASDEIIKSATDWKIEHTGILTDHKMVSTCIIDPKTPFIGCG